MADGSENTFIGWLDLYRVIPAETEGEDPTESLVLGGKGTLKRSVDTKPRKAYRGTSKRPTRKVETEVTESATIETDELSDALFCIAYGIPLGTDLTEAEVAIGDGGIHESSLILKAYDTEEASEPRIIRAGFGAMLSLDGDISFDKENFSSAKVMLDFEGAVGTIRNRPAGETFEGSEGS